MQLIDLYDEIEIKKTAGRGVFAGGDAELYGEDNLCVKGVKKALEFLTTKKKLPENLMNFGVEVSLKKNIPTAAGLGGGSADAAVSILGTLDLLGGSLDITHDELMTLGMTVGSDVPFMLTAHSFKDMHACVVRGAGERVERAEPLAGAVLLRRLEFPVSTKEVYAEWDRLASPSDARNDLELPAFKLHPEIEREKKALAKKYPDKLVMMSGSGPSLFVYFPEGVSSDSLNSSDLAAHFL
jgi:4-diphosphocytidyl-2-C-methyl-D-erythritol kinase